MTSLTPKRKKTTFRVQLAANTPGHPDHEEAITILAAEAAEVAGITVSEPEPVAVRIDSKNLERFDRDGIELVINTQTGEAFATQNGYARMSQLSKQSISQRLKKLVNSGGVKTAEIDTGYGLKKTSLIPVKIVMDWFLTDYHQNPTQQIFKTLIAFYQQQGLDTSGLINLHNFNKGNKSKLKGTDREKQIQLAYHLRYGGELEYPTANGRIDLLTPTTLYEFKIFKNYKECLGQLLAYDDCVPQMKLCAVLFGVPKALRFSGSECQRVESLLNKYGIVVKFLR